MNRIKIVTGKDFAEVEKKANDFIQEEQIHVVSAQPFNSVSIGKMEQKDEDGKKQVVDVQIIEPFLVLLHS